MEKFTKYKQLSYEQRNQIQYYLSMNLSHRKIASLLEVSNPTISREVRRNTSTQRRSPNEKYITTYDAIAVPSRRARNRLKATDEFLNIIKKELSGFNSITTIVGKWRCHQKNFPSAVTIYTWVKQGYLILKKSYRDAFKLKQTHHLGRVTSKGCEKIQN